MKKILVIDDNKDIATLVEMIFKMNDYDVRTAEKAGEIDHTIREFNPDLIMLDITLPDGDGREVCRQLKQTKEFEKISIILFSANTELGYDYHAYHADGYIEKPFELPKLLTTVESYLL
jgi:DNA-binding response OmpR family regulator